MLQTSNEYNAGDPSDAAYAKMMLGHEDKRWVSWAGHVLLVDLRKGIDPKTSWGTFSKSSTDSVMRRKHQGTPFPMTNQSHSRLLTSPKGLYQRTHHYNNNETLTSPASDP